MAGVIKKLYNHIVTGIQKSSGLTPSEQYLKKLCERSFLSLWSYPNLYRDQGSGHELCDLLVVFEDDVIIFSDKSCSFQDTGDLEKDWGRWFRSAVSESAKQIFGAERWIKNHPDRIYLDKRCTQKFPLDLSNASRLRFHRIVVALGAGERCRRELGNNGSLVLMPKRSDGTESPFNAPLSVGWVVPGKPYVHVLDDVSLDVILRELDTVADFTKYLRKKEDFVASGRLLIASGELDLLGLYLRTMRGEEHDFSTHDTDLVALDDGVWEELVASPEYSARKRRNQVSYLWDGLIEAFATHLQDGTLAIGRDLGIQTVEPALRLMASESRLARRMLGDALDDLFHKTPTNGKNTRVVTSRDRGERAYVLSLVSSHGYPDYSEYRRIRENRLLAYCHVAKHLWPNLEHVVGVGAEPAGSAGGSEDLLYLDARTWTQEQEDWARRLHQEHGLLKRARFTQTMENEFPDPRRATMTMAQKRVLRNQKKRERRERANKNKKR
ncbi:hypothetical protein WMF26_06925 [Sorangium sp. So ce185]|uniref:hypothetical protein n=1 Tax=Sorangium sp. So ce185 TaxID=3133287 RepID=UPI003F5F273F